MLYVTTHGSVTYTAQKTLESARSADGGLFVPLRLPHYHRGTLQMLLRNPFWQIVAEVLNGFFPVGLTAGSLGNCGLLEPSLEPVGYKLFIAELWNWESGSYAGLRGNILRCLGSKTDSPESWPALAVDIAMLFGLYGLLCGSGKLRIGDRIPVAMAAGELSFPVATVYAREMGLPLGLSVCVCNENAGVWELLHKGEARLENKARATRIPSLDIGVPANLERLVAYRLGNQTAEPIRTMGDRRITMLLEPEQQSRLRRDLYVIVSSSHRALTLIPNLHQNFAYLMSPHTALIYGGLMDYRALERTNGAVLLLAEECPICPGK